jgi:nickel-dependent lactate racemase
MTTNDITEKIEKTFQKYSLKGKKVLAIIPDGTRSAPVDLMFSLFNRYYAPEVKQLDYLVALGTHPLMTEEQLCKRVGISLEEKEEQYKDTRIFNHRWDLEDTFTKVGTIGPSEMAELSGGLSDEEAEITVNKLIFDYDILLILGPVFPHEIAGFSGSNKYLFPGICGWEFTDCTHWLGALKTNIGTIGYKDTPARRLIDRAAEFIPIPIVYFNMVVNEEGLQGLFVGGDKTAWETAVELSSQLNIQYEPKQYKTVLSVAAAKYDDYWTGAKAFYKLEPIVADGGTIIVYAPHIDEISITHNEVIKNIGFHTVDYFKNNLDTKFRDVPRAVLAYSALVTGKGSYKDGKESTRITHKLASAIPKKTLDSLNLQWEDAGAIDPGEWQNRNDPEVKVVFNAGERLYRPSE